MELTKEHFNEIVKNLSTKKDLDGLATKSDLDGLATKNDLDERLEATERRVIKRIDEAQEELARMVADGFVDIQNRLDVRDQIQKFERKFEKLEEALHITL